MRACPRCLTVYESDPEFCSFDGTKTVVFTDDEDPLEGLALDDFVLERRLGVGGTGCVYRGRDRRTGERAAIKLLFGEMATDKGLAERFRREAKAMQAIRHPNVVSVIDCRTSEAGVTYLAMEYVEGLTLKQIVEQEAPLAPGRVARLAEQLVAGMAQAHRMGYVHRDLKPSNVMVSGPPGSEVAKILDFGIVASLHEQEQDNRLTKTGYIVGTPTYMAPEQVDPKSVTPQADVYALGVMIYEMLAGKPPFGGTLEQILVAKMTSPPPPLKGAGELGALVIQLLATDPEDRPPTALHVSAELARLSLLSADPATEKARVPELPSLGVVGFGQATVHLVDRTGENPLSPATTVDGTMPNPIPDATQAERDSQDIRTDATPAPPLSELRETAEGPWSVDTRLVPDPALSPADTGPIDGALDAQTPEDAYPDFAAEGDTQAAARNDTVVDVNPLDMSSAPQIDAASFSDTSGPTNPEHDARAGHDATYDDDLPAELPTRVASVQSLSGFGRSASSASGEHTPTDEEERDTEGDLMAQPDEANDDDGDATAILASIEDEEEEDDDTSDSEIGFADTRIRPTHHPESSAPTWSPVGGAVSAIDPPRLVDPAEVAVTAFEPARVGASAELVDDDSPFSAVPRVDDDGPTSLSSLLPGPDDEDDPGDGDTALDFSLEDLGVANTDLGLSSAKIDEAAGFVDPPPATAASTPPGPAPRSRWWLGALFATLLVLAAALTYRALGGAEVIDISPSPDSPSSP